jgi:hypothetical protein
MGHSCVYKRELGSFIVPTKLRPHCGRNSIGLNISFLYILVIMINESIGTTYNCIIKTN